MAAKAWKIRTERGSGPLAIFYSAWEVFALVAFVAACGEIFFNVWFVSFYGGAGTVARESIWKLAIPCYFMGVVYRVNSQLAWKRWAGLLTIQSGFMLAWIGLGHFEVSQNVVPGAPSFPGLLWVSTVEVAYYWLWLGIITVSLRPIQVRRRSVTQVDPDGSLRDQEGFEGRHPQGDEAALKVQDGPVHVHEDPGTART